MAIAGAVPLVAWLCVLAKWPQTANWLDIPESVLVALTVIALTSVCVLVLRARGDRRPGTAAAAIAVGLAATGALLGLSSLWDCHGGDHMPVFQPLIWTAELIKGGSAEAAIKSGACPHPTPAALVVAQLAALGAIFTGLSGVAFALFRSQVDRLQANHASSVTAVIGVDTDSSAMLGGIARTLNRRDTLVVIVDTADEHSAHGARTLGARVVTVDLNAPSSLTSLPLWRRLQRLYLLSGDPSNNLLWLEAVTEARERAGNRGRLPLVVRVDDPWQAEAWRTQQLGGADSQWAVDTLGKYELTASWLMDTILAIKVVRRVFVCGTSQLTLALCADLTRRKLERDYYSPPTEAELPAFTLVGEDADESHRDQEFQREQFGLLAAGPTIDVEPTTPTIPVLERLINTGDPATSAVIFVDDWTRGPRGAATLGSRLAARFPTLPVYSWDPDSQVSNKPVPIVGRLRTFRLMLEFPDCDAPDVWERAASLIHERYLSTLDPEDTLLPSRLPWTQLNEFYRGSNRRQVRNALWMVEQIAGHTWNPWGDVPTPLAERDIVGLPPLKQLEKMGFDHASAIEMARAEHEDWCRYYRKNSWKYGPNRDDRRQIHDKLVGWSVVQSDQRLLDGVLRSVANTLWSLRQLGYRSHPVWWPYARAGTVTAEQRDAPWTWISPSGATMQADPGDWLVHDGGAAWSVRNDIFRSTYRHIGGKKWQRCGTVLARPARPGETIETAEGPTAAADGDWVVKGEAGDQWPVPADVFALHYAQLPPA
ncbi:hypothetical protein [Mycolicibacter nonchromogenicus]|uniref:hypothetical protein n=1 Tax=Mycolicibacter nonchromogenicus TaxID=1782 RepID=UPI001F216C18|nr:hypothetical protein [Mycolicibacter nonchromogenicus]